MHLRKYIKKSGSVSQCMSAISAIFRRSLFPKAIRLINTDMSSIKLP